MEALVQILSVCQDVDHSYDFPHSSTLRKNTIPKKRYHAAHSTDYQRFQKHHARHFRKHQNPSIYPVSEMFRAIHNSPPSLLILVYRSSLNQNPVILNFFNISPILDISPSCLAFIKSPMVPVIFNPYVLANSLAS